MQDMAYIVGVDYASVVDLKYNFLYRWTSGNELDFVFVQPKRKFTHIFDD